MTDKPKMTWRRFFLWHAVTTGTLFFVFLALEWFDDSDQIRSALLPAAIIAPVVTTLLWLVYRFDRWVRSWLNIRRFLIGVGCLAALVVLFYAEENWRGKRAWENYKREQEAKGEKLTLPELAPPPVPDDRNLAVAPIVASCYLGSLMPDGKPRKPQDANVVNRLNLPIYRKDAEGIWEQGGPKTGSWQLGTLTDLAAWRDYYHSPTNAKGEPYLPNEFAVPPQPQTPARDVLFALSKYDASVAELVAETQRRLDCRFPLDYLGDNPSMMLLPHLASMKGCVQGLNLCTIAELADGKREKALVKVGLMFRLSEGVRHEPILISHLVRIAANQIAVQSVWEGLARHQWTDADLVEIQKQLARQDLLADYQVAMRGERAFSVGTIEYVRRHPREMAALIQQNPMGLSDDGEPGESPLSVGLRFVPNSFYYLNQLNIAKMEDRYLLPVVDVRQRTVNPGIVRRFNAAFEQELSGRISFTTIFARLLLPALDKVPKKTAFAQSATDLAVVACALERYRLAHGDYPETLAALTPQFIAQVPHDVINGQPLFYRRTDDGQFVLYSVGWNETDDGGVVAEKENTKIRSVDIDQGDWVWRYPAK